MHGTSEEHLPSGEDHHSEQHLDSEKHIPQEEHHPNEDPTSYEYKIGKINFPECKETQSEHESPLNLVCLKADC